jgi:hypothetical protein
VAVVAGIPALVLIWLVTAVVRAATSDDPLARGPREVPCAEALEFGGARLLTGAYDPCCTVEVWPDTRVRGRVPDAARRAGRLARPHLSGRAAAYRVLPGRHDRPVRERRLRRGRRGADARRGVPGFGAHTANVLVDYEGPATALVRFSAFTV